MAATLLISLALVGCSGDTTDPDLPPPPEPGELMVGAAQVRMPVPLGIGTAGNGPLGVTADPTPFSEIYPGTTRIHEHPDFRAIAISRGEGFEAIFLRVDTVGTFQQLRRAVVLELQARTGRDLDDALIIGATHTHSGPGRIIDAGGPFELIADRFLPEFYDGMVQAMADAVELALDDLKPGRVGYAFADGAGGINDRRCEDGGPDYVNGTLPVLAIEQEGELAAVMLAYAIHGTVLGIDELTLSQDVSGGIEHAVEDRFDQPVMVQMFNSWGADMSPANPEVTMGPGAPQPEDYDRIERVGTTVADAVEVTLADLQWTDEPDIVSRTTRTWLDRDAIGYEPGVFNYEYGGVYCSSSTEEDCDPSTTIDDLDQGCVPFSEEYGAPNQTLFTAGHVGDLHFVTFPGEPGTELAEQVLADVQSMGADDIMFLGYSQDYTGYSILEEDWWQGGYEAGGALWGPRQGEYLAVEAADAYGVAVGARQPSEQPEPLEPFGTTGYDPYVAPTALDLGSVLVDVPGQVAPNDIVVLTVAGHDPWFGAPVAYLESADGTPALRPNGEPIDSDGVGFWIDLVPDPPYTDGLDLPERTFQWQYSMPASHGVPGAFPELQGEYRLRVELPDGQGGTVEATSSTFEVTAG